MFRELFTYSVSSNAQSGHYSLQHRATSGSLQVILAFWAGSVHPCFCLGEFMDSVITAKKPSKSSSLTLLFSRKFLLFLLGSDDLSTKLLTSELEQILSISVIPTILFEELDK